MSPRDRIIGQKIVGLSMDNDPGSHILISLEDGSVVKIAITNTFGAFGYSTPMQSISLTYKQILFSTVEDVTEAVT